MGFRASVSWLLPVDDWIDRNRAQDVRAAKPQERARLLLLPALQNQPVPRGEGWRWSQNLADGGDEAHGRGNCLLRVRRRNGLSRPGIVVGNLLEIVGSRKLAGDPLRQHRLGLRELVELHVDASVRLGVAGRTLETRACAA